jgi:hypothetical protein
MSTLNVDKVDPSTGTALEIGSSGDTITIPSGATIVNSGTATGFGITQTSFLPTAAPLWYNGDLQIAQRGTSSSISGTTTGYFTCDRWFFELNDSSVWTQSQDTDVPTGYGFAKSLKLDCTTLDATPTYTVLQQKFEGQNLQVFKKGTANAEKYTLAFWVKSVKTGTYICELRDFDNNRTVSQAYTVDSGSTWEKKILNFPADTTGAFGNDNNASLAVSFFLAVSSTYSSGTLATVWESRTNANRAVGQVNLADSTSNNFWITGVQLEVGEYVTADLPPFRHETYGENLLRCERYFTRIAGIDYSPYQNGVCVSTIAAYGYIQNPVRKRASPSWSHSGTVEDFDVYTNASTGYPLTTFLFAYIYEQGCTTNLRVASGLNAGYAFSLIDGALGDTYIDIDAEI